MFSLHSSAFSRPTRKSETIAAQTDDLGGFGETRIASHGATSYGLGSACYPGSAAELPPGGRRR